MPISGRPKSSYQIIITFSLCRLGSGVVEGLLLTSPLAQPVLQKAANKPRSSKLTVINHIMWKVWGIEGEKKKWSENSVFWVKLPKHQHAGIYLVVDAHTQPLEGGQLRDPALRLAYCPGSLQDFLSEYLLKVPFRIWPSWWACN